MSFILDALKKSESDRQRQGGPALFEVKVAPPRSALPPWAIAIAVLFAANLGVVGWLLLRHAATPADTAPPAVAATDAPMPRALTSSAAAPVAAAPVPVPAAAAPAASSAPASTPTSAPPAFATAASEHGPPPAAEPALNPDDYVPAAEPPPAASGTSHVQRGTAAGVPLYQQLIATPGNQMPQLRLDLLAYADRAEDRWVLINMRKLREGDSTPEGTRVEHITPDGAVLSWHSAQFLLTRE